MTSGDGADLRAAGDMVETLLAAGGQGIDTANGYAGGRSEALVADLSPTPGEKGTTIRPGRPGIPLTLYRED